MLDIHDEDAVRVLVLDRPDRLNAFTAETYRALTAALEDAAADDHVAVVVLTGAGRAFSSGVDLDELARPGGADELGLAFDPLLAELASFPKPLVAAVNGLAVGFGMTILLHCDLVLVAEEARFRAPFADMGIAPEAASTWLLPRLVGPQQAAWILLSGEWLDAREAVQLGLAWRVSPPGRVADDAVGVARQLAAHPVPVLVATKRLLREGSADAVAAAWQRERDEMVTLAGRARRSV